MSRRTVSLNEDDVMRAQEREQKAVGDARKDRDAKFKETWRVPPRYEVRRMLGSGAYGNVCEAKDREGKRRVAIKQARHLLDDLMDAKRILREVAILSMLDHRHVVKMYDVIVPENLKRFNELYIVLEVCDSDLKKLCRADVHLSPLHITSLLYNLLAGLHYIHSAGIWHRDLKPANCLVNEDCCVKICDFGLARAIGSSSLGPDLDEGGDREKRQLTGHVVTRWYRAPELILLQDSYTVAIDMWSVGCIYAELLGMLEGVKFADRAPLFPGHTCFPLSPHAGHKTDTKYYTKGQRDQMAMIVNLLGTPSAEDIAWIDGDDAQGYMRCFGKKEGTGVLSRFSILDPVGAELLDSMLVFNPFKRVGVRQALDHRLFRKIRDRKVETVAPEPVTLDFETEASLDEQTLRRFFLREVSKFHPREVTL